MYGYATSYSTELSVVASDKPAQMAIVTVATSGTTVVVTWVAPDTNSAAIDGYEIYFTTSTGTFV